MNASGARHTPEASFDLTPMIDVVLLLIIFFMLTSQFTQSNLSPMNLPRAKGEASPEKSEKANAAVIIDMSASGDLRLMEEDVPLDRLIQLVAADVKRAAASGGAIDVVIRADRSCPALYLNRLAGTLTQVGVRKWRLATEGDGSDSSPPAPESPSGAGGNP